MAEENEYFKCDDKGRLCWEKYPDGIEKYYDYDENGNLTYFKLITGDETLERWWEYENGICTAIRWKNSDMNGDGINEKYSNE